MIYIYYVQSCHSITGGEKGLNPVGVELRLGDKYWTLNKKGLKDNVVLAGGVCMELNRSLLVDKWVGLR